MSKKIIKTLEMLKLILDRINWWGLFVWRLVTFIAALKIIQQFGALEF